MLHSGAVVNSHPDQRLHSGGMSTSRAQCEPRVGHDRSCSFSAPRQPPAAGYEHPVYAPSVEKCLLNSCESYYLKTSARSIF